MKTLRAFGCLLLALSLVAPAWAQYNVAPTGGCTSGNAVRWDGANWTCESIGGTSIPAGLITFVVTGTCPAGWSEVTALNGKAIYGTLAANADVGGAVGSDTITPTVNSLTAAAQTFTGSSTTVPAETVNSLTAAAQTVNSLTAAAQAFTGTPFSGVITHTHTQASTTTATGSGSNRLGTVDTSSTAVDTGAPAGAVASITPAGTNASSAVTGTMNSSAVTGTLNSTTITPLGSNAASAVTGTLNSFDNRPAGIKAIFCSKD